MLIDLIELHGATPLNKPLAREEDLFLECRDFLSDLDRWDGDLLLQGISDRGEYTIVLSPANGVIFTFNSGGAGKQESVEYAAVASPKEIGVYSLSDRRKLTLSPFYGHLKGSLGLRMDDDANNLQEGRSRLTFGLGVTSDRQETKSPFELHIALAPVCFTDLMHRLEAEYSLRNGMLTISTVYGTFRLDAASGKLLEFLLKNEADEKDAKRDQPTGNVVSKKPPSAQSREYIRISFVPDEYRRRLQTIRDAVAEAPNAYDARRPISSFLTFICDDNNVWRQLGMAERDRRVPQLVRRMLDQDVCEPFDKLVHGYGMGIQNDDSSGTNDDFVIPALDAPAAAAGGDDFRNVAVCAFAVSHMTFRPGSWPEMLSRSLWYLSHGHPETSILEIQKIYKSDKNGPLCYLALGEVFLMYGVAADGR